MSARPGPRLDVIDALRGFAALAVVFYHVWNSIYPWATTQMGPILGNPSHAWWHESWPYYVSFFLFQYGYFGVTIFFVLSGFCIHLPQARRRVRSGDDGLQLGPFFRRRFWRLYPAYFASLFVAAIGMGAMRWMDCRIQGTTLPPELYAEAFGYREIFDNAVFMLPFFPAASDLNSVLWTLIFEVQFYLLYPFLLWTIRRVGWVPMGLVLLIAEILLVEQPKTLTSERVVNPWEYFFLARYFEWFLGAAAAEAYTRRGFVLSWKLGMIGSGLGAICSLTSTFLPVLWPYRELFVSMSTVCVMSMLLQQRAELPGHLLRWLAGVGVYSYSLYLLHYPMLRLVNVMNGLIAELFGVALDHRTFMILLIPTLPIVFAASYGFYWLFERPFLTLYRTEVPNRKTLPLVTKAEPTGTVRSTSVPCATPPAPVAMP